jgi:hypothetical protein
MYNITSKLLRNTEQNDYEDILVGLGGHYLVKEQQNYEEITGQVERIWIMDRIKNAIDPT